MSRIEAGSCPVKRYVVLAVLELWVLQAQFESR